MQQINTNTQSNISRKQILRKDGFIREILKNKFLYLLTMPGIIFFLVFNYAPMVGVIVAFKNFNYKKGIFGSDWAGVDNFKFLFKSGEIWGIMFNTVYLNILFIITGTIAAVILAVMFVEVQNKWFKKISQSLSILPNFISWTIIALFLEIFIASDTGIITHLLAKFGTEINFYRDPSVWPTLLVLLKIWHGAGYGSIVYIATLTGIDPSLYEAAEIDGASRLQRIVKITIPLLKPTVVLLTLFSVGKIFAGDFGMIYALIGDNSFLLPTTDVIDTYVYRALRTLGDVGMSSATGLFQSVLGFIFVMGANAIAKKMDSDSAIF